MEGTIESLAREETRPHAKKICLTIKVTWYSFNLYLFSDHYSGNVSSEDPRTPKLYGADQPFRWRFAYFRYMCMTNVAVGTVRIPVKRNSLLRDSFLQVMKCQAHELRRRLFVVFNQEDGLDYGGPLREWFLLLTNEILNPSLDLFEYVSDENYSMQINPESSKRESCHTYFRFFGRILALAIFHGCFIYTGFALPFYRRLLQKKTCLEEVKSIDPEFYNSMKWIETTNMDEAGADLCFSSDWKCCGETKEHELKPGGAEIRVTEENKGEYVRLMVEWRLTRGQELQMKAILDGFKEIMPLDWIKYFNEHELDLVMCGRPEIDVDDWQKNTVYRHCGNSSQEIKWFWQFVRSLDNDGRARLLQFVTGSCRVPLGGFAELMGTDTNAPQKFCIEKVGKNNYLPRSHTCFNRLDLPPYTSYGQLCERLTLALLETEGFGRE